MAQRGTKAGGIFLFLGPVIGAIYGVDRGQPIVWMLSGFGIGLAFAIAIWLVDRRKG
jgi:cyanate permease